MSLKPSAILPAASLCLSLVLAFAAPCLANITGSGKVSTENRPVAGVQAVDLAGIGELTITQGASESLSVEAEDNIASLIQTTVEKGTLRITIKSTEKISPTKPVRYKLAVKNVSKIILSGSGDVHALKLGGTDAVDVQLSGSGDVTLDQLDCKKLSLSLAGSGDITLAGSAKDLSINLGGSGDIDASGLKADTAAVNLGGSGDCELSAKDKLDVNLGGSGSVSYHGKPALTKKIGGSGTVRPVVEG